jgi:hypothetical protein
MIHILYISNDDIVTTTFDTVGDFKTKFVY